MVTTVWVLGPENDEAAIYDVRVIWYAPSRPGVFEFEKRGEGTRSQASFWDGRWFGASCNRAGFLGQVHPEIPGRGGVMPDSSSL